MNQICQKHPLPPPASFVATLLLLLFTFIWAPDIVRAQDDDDETTEADESKVKAQDQEFSARGFNQLRIEQEDKITVPLEKEEEVWNFLFAQFIADTVALKKLDPHFTAYFNEERFADTYFDTPSLQLYAMQSGVRHRRRVNLTNASDRKSGRELMQIKVNSISANTLERGELKYGIRRSTEYKTPEDGHPMLGIVKPSHREDFKEQLIKLGLDPYSMRPILTVHDSRRRIYIQRDRKTIMSISLDHVISRRLSAKAEFVEIEPELNEIVFTEADSATRNYMEETNAKICTMIEARFPEVKRDLTPKYNKSFDALATRISFFRYLVRLDMDNKNGLAGFATLSIATLVCGFIFVKRLVAGKTSC